MAGRVRYFLALAFVAAFFLFPAADREEIAFLQTKSWVTDLLGEHFGASEDAADPPPPIPALRVDYAVADGTDQLTGTQRARREARPTEYSRIVRTWARSEGREIDASAPPLALTVRIGTNGFQAQLAHPGGTSLTEPQTLRILHTASADEPATAGSYYPDRWSLLPAFLAIILAILTGRIIPSLLAGCAAGALRFVGLEQATAAGEYLGVDVLWGEVLTDQFNLEILGFVVFLFMAVGVMARSGGIEGMVTIVSRFARGPVSTQITTWIVGLLIFFDDYSNCIVTGSTMRPLSDRNRISREKLSYIVDSTAAPIAGVALFSNWIAYEVSMFAPQLPEVLGPDGTPYQQSDGFSVFIQTLPLRFYCIFTLVFVFLTIILRREFGPMRHAAERAARGNAPLAPDAKPMVSEALNRTEPAEGVPRLARNAILPIVMLIVTTVSLTFTFGWSALDDASKDLPTAQLITAVLDGGQTQRALCIGGAVALMLAILLAVAGRILSLGDAVMSALRSARSLVFAMIIVILAWAIGAICRDMGTAQFLTAAFQDSFSPWLLPAIMFLIASLIAFSTGTSYGTMAILLPNVVVLSHTMGELDPNLGGPALMLLTIGAVLEGSIFGDHCSPISDTTVMSSLSTGSDHMHHVRTQAPYAVTVMVIAMLGAYIPVALAGPEFWWIGWAIGGVAMLLWLMLAGTRIDYSAPDPESGTEPA